MLFDWKTKNKYGFSMFEVVVTMAIISIFIAAASNVFTQKFKKKIAIPAHGRFECYYDNNDVLHQRLISENVVVQDTNVSTGHCTFEPVKAAAYLAINAVAAGGSGGRSGYSSSYGGSAGAYTSIFLTTTTHKLSIYPGKKTTYNYSNIRPRGDDTYITDDDSNNREVMRLKGGRSNSGSSLSYSSCEVSYKEYNCRREAFCNILESENKIRVGYCSCDNEDASCEAIKEYTYSNLTTSSSSSNFYCTGNENASPIKFCTQIDTSKTVAYLGGKTVLYNLFLRKDGNFTTGTQPSDFEVYLNALDLTDGVATVTNPKPGEGGARGQSGGPGAVVIAW